MEIVMSFEDLKVRIAMMLDAMVHQPQDLHEAQEQLREELAEMQAMGLPLPDDLVKLESDLEAALTALPPSG
jgi:hypothetical protein